ncbi:myo-inositol-1(or 4)-monophosphatase [Microbacterium trichothecenolyticum]|uniref:inositol monophosphatase family protein n=1 Tax=Microbacterium trichothecenolyticum TaxID=69370 RepID=UPI00285D9B56|nr:inositol monophosphatase family protein [Microbacterium trichothecenolyticum]MDR7111010.1 myo-inositol-1(or 4)-monophosphatase [Microbacterium trichothecenolyticum]
MSLEHDLESLAIDIAREAGELARTRREAGVAIAATKTALADIVTEADREVEALIRARLRAARPEDGFLGEETGGDRGTTGVTWVVDPIDGTVNYAYGIPSYAVSIAAVQGEPTPEAWEALAGVVYTPVLGEMFHAARGEGAWLGVNRLAVNPEVGGAGALLATGFGYDPATRPADIELIGRVMPAVPARDLRRGGSAASDLAFVAAGRLDGYFERGLAPWDLAAGSLLVTEAGGRFGRAEPDGGPRAPLVVAATPAIFDRLAAAAGLA